MPKQSCIQQRKLLSIPELLEVDSRGRCFETVSKHALCFETPSVGWGGGGRSSNIHPSPPPRLAPLRASSATVLLINVSSQSQNFPNSECRKTVEICRLTPFCPNPKKQLPYLQLQLQSWTRGVSRLTWGLFDQQLSKFLPFLQALQKLKKCCWTAGPSAPGAMSYLGPDTSRFIVA